MKNEKLAALVIEAQKGNQKALSDLIESCYNDIYYFALKTVKKEDVAADITQDACLKIIQSLGKLNEPMAFKSWALRITYNLCSTHFSTPQDVLVEENEDGETVFDTLADDSEDAQPDKAYENAEFKQMMRDMIESLPAEQASALMLYYYEKASVKEIAEIHGVSEGTVKSRLNYGRKAVKEKVEDYEKRTGIRLHSITPLPLLLAWFFAQSAEKAPATVAAAISSSVAGAAGAAATAAGVSAAAGATAATTAGAAAATVAAKAGVSALAAKVIAIVVGAALAVSAAVGGIYIATNNSDTEITEEDDNDDGDNYGDNYGDNGDENNGENNGENSGENGENTPPAHTHTYENGFCTVCGEAKPSEGLEFTLNDDGESYSVTDIGTCLDTNIVIPATHEGKPVTDIHSSAFRNERNIEGIIIPEGVTNIDYAAFRECTSLATITIPNSVTSIGDDAFRECTSLATITIPNSVTSIGDDAFVGCTSLTSINIPNSVTSIGGGTFGICTSLTSITIPDSVTSIGENAFRECTSLATITIPNSVTSIGENAFRECTSLATITIPNSVTSIGKYAFRKCTSLATITIPNSVTSIGIEAFEDCTSLTGITIPFVGEKKDGTGATDFDCIFGGTAPASLKTVTITGGSSIDDRAFRDCGSITSITIPDSVTSIGENAFRECTSLASVTIGNSVTTIGESAFRDCTSLATITIPNSVTSIGYCAFEDCSSLTGITIPFVGEKKDGTENTDFDYIFGGTVPTSLKTVIITGGSSIGRFAFFGCTSITSVTIPDSVTSIGNYAFENCTSLTSITIPKSVTSIAYCAFENCTSLTSITIPKSVTSIGDRVFYDCSKLTSINYDGTIAEWEALEKIGRWNENTPMYTVHCTDGDITK